MGKSCNGLCGLQQQEGRPFAGGITYETDEEADEAEPCRFHPAFYRHGGRALEAVPVYELILNQASL